MTAHQPIRPARRADRVEMLLGRKPTCFADYLEAGGYEFDQHFTDSAGKPSPWQPGSRKEYAEKFAAMECPRALRLAALAEMRAGGL